MSDEKKDKELKPLYRETILDQIKTSEEVIAKLRANIAQLERDLEQNIGVLNHAKFVLEHYVLSSKPEEPKKPNLEVK